MFVCSAASISRKSTEHLGVSWNRGTPKSSSISNDFPVHKNHPTIKGYPHDELETPTKCCRRSWLDVLLGGSVVVISPACPSRWENLKDGLSLINLDFCFNKIIKGMSCTIYIPGNVLEDSYLRFIGLLWYEPKNDATFYHLVFKNHVPPLSVQVMVIFRTWVSRSFFLGGTLGDIFDMAMEIP